MKKFVQSRCASVRAGLLPDVYCLRNNAQHPLFRRTPLSKGGSSRAATSSSNLRRNSHNSLPSFIKYAETTSLARRSTVYVGTLYEYQCKDALLRLGFALERTGGAGDAGVDLSGTWILPSTAAAAVAADAPPPQPSSLPSRPPILRLPVIAQCKALNRKTGPALVRELEGTLAARAPGTVGLLCATKTATKGVRDALRNSRAPMVWLQIEQRRRGDSGAAGAAAGSEDGGDPAVEHHPAGNVPATGTDDMLDQPGAVRIRQMLWNEEVERIGARGMTVGLVRISPAMDSDSSNEDDEVALLWNGEVWDPK